MLAFKEKVSLWLKLPGKILFTSYLEYDTICRSKGTLKSTVKRAVKDLRAYTITAINSNSNNFGDAVIFQRIKKKSPYLFLATWERTVSFKYIQSVIFWFWRFCIAYLFLVL